jgi:hypothetical protein
MKLQKERRDQFALATNNGSTNINSKYSFYFAPPNYAKANNPLYQPERKLSDDQPSQTNDFVSISMPAQQLQLVDGRVRALLGSSDILIKE